MRVLIVKTSSLGDIIHTFPVMSWIKKYFPDCLIDWVVERPFSDLLHHHPHVHKVIEVDVKKWRHALFSPGTWREIVHAIQSIRQVRYDLAFDLQGNSKSGIILACVKAFRKVGFGKKSVSEWPNRCFTRHKFEPPAGRNIRQDYLYIIESALRQKSLSVTSTILSPWEILQPFNFKITPPDVEWVNQLLHNSKKYILVCPGANWENKRLSLETLSETMGLLRHRYPTAFCLYVWGNDSEKRICELLHEEALDRSAILPRLNLPTLQYLMSKVDCVLAMDSLPLHLAGTTATPTLGLFGPSSAKKYAPLGTQHRTIQGVCPYGKTFEKRCPLLRSCPTGACLKNLKAEDICDGIY